ncbi:MAG: CBS domain-containing protein [Cytophagales bacterium]|nr:CBS domain-containing protein [Cytophagales bacterium]
MGELNIHVNTSGEERLQFLQHLLNDLKALERMHKEGMIEDDAIRIGAEQEFCLVNEQWRPATNAMEVLQELNDPHFTTELARFNLEINLNPVDLKGSAFSQMEGQLNQLMQKANEAADKHGSKIVLTGILPSISMHEMELDFMTPLDRYYALNDLFKKARGGDFRMHFSGVDEFSINHNSVMFEACNTSFQMHLQIRPDDFVQSYNWSQAIAGPVLAACVNSPLLLGKELWCETRIALFQQTLDTRVIARAHLDKQARVTFGSNWVHGDVVDYFKHEVSKYKALLTREIEQNSLETLKGGQIPKLQALSLHNGTIYRWNRPCYGVGGGKPHIRIENRYIPAGPSVKDEMANLAFWVGLMVGRPAEFDDLPKTMDFQDAKANFLRACRNGTETVMSWKGKRIPLADLISEELLPIARTGLQKMNIDEADINQSLEVIEKRMNGHTGSQWMVSNYRRFKKSLKTDDALIALTESLHRNQQSYESINEWPTEQDLTTFNSAANKVGHIMKTTLVTADAGDSGEMTLRYMKWNNVHHLPVVDQDERLVGLITWQHLFKYLDEIMDADHVISAGEIMIKEVISVESSTPIKEAINLMRAKNIGCLPVVEENHLVGIITVKDVLKFADA